MLQRSCHQAVLGFDRIVLTSCPFRLVARPFTSQGPLTLELTRFLFNLAERGDGDRDPVQRQGFEQDAFDMCIDRQRAHFADCEQPFQAIVSTCFTRS